MSRKLLKRPCPLSDLVAGDYWNIYSPRLFTKTRGGLPGTDEHSSILVESEEVLNFNDRNHVKPMDEIYPF